MHRTSAFVAFAAIASMIIPADVDAQARRQQVQDSGPLVLGVRPRSLYRLTPSYPVGSTYEPRNAFNPIQLAPPLGPSANNVTITLPISSAQRRFTRVDATLFASRGCLGQ
ncbi:hypothetical protein HPT29_021315 [Microvirga terrae]|uniref:Uncharacterized protein n=1 Tax=Microvirga terrae TaxID=2740529 RepID=A0ABY5RP09_9HYPH|nr:hypothetical protein [Microvirga terrae]UVF18978.1 hypothetical protein HPT29_021315 [Microvirga terrae]